VRLLNEEEATSLQSLSRAAVESDTHFLGNKFCYDSNQLGFLVLQNKLKMDTTASIEVLKKAKLKTLMVTGDNPLTAIYVARECGMISQFPAYLADTFIGIFF
jgi:P-type E1-E2 ATPase